MVLVPIIRVRDSYTGKTHIVGTDHHDRLVMSTDGRSLDYLNIQNMSGTHFMGYRFQLEEMQVGPDDFEHEVEMVTVDEAIKIWREEERRQEKAYKQMQELLAKKHGGKAENYRIIS